MNYFQGITVDDHVTGTEMLASYARIRAKFDEVRAPVPPPPKPAKSAGSGVGHRQPVPDDKALARAVDRLASATASATQGLAAAISRHDEGEAMARQDSISTAEEPPNKPPPSVDKIQRVVARHYGVTRTDILSQRRTAAVVRPRQVAMYLAKTMTLRSLPEIGRLFGGRDHTTVLHAVRKIDALVKIDLVLADVIAAIRAELAEGQQQ